MDPSTVQDEQHHHLDSQQVTHGAEEEEDVAHPPDLENKSYMTRVKAKARKIKDSIKKHYGHNESNNEHDEEPHTPDHDHDHDHHLDEEEDKEMFEDPEVHEKPINEREVVKSATPASEQVETFHKPGNDFEFQGTKVAREEQPHQDDSLVEPAFSTTEFNHKIHDIPPTTTDPAKTFSAEKKPEVLDEDLHEKGSRPEEYTLPSYQTKVADRSEAGSGELIEDITPVQEPHYDPLVEGVNSTTDIDQHLAADPIKTFAGEEKPEYNKFNSERPNVLEGNLEVQGSRPEAYTHPNYQTKITDDASRDGSDEIKDFKGVEESFERMNVHDKPTFADTEYPPAKNHDQSVPSFSAETKTQNEYPRETLSTDNTNPQIPSETRETSINIADFNSNSEAVEKSATPASEKDKNLGESGIDFEGTKAVGEGHHQYPLAEGVSSTTEINQKPEEYKFKLEEPIVLQEGSHEQGSRAEAYDLPNYQTEVTDPRGAGSDEIKDIAKIEDSFERMNVNNEPTDVDHEYLNKNHDQFVPHLSDATKTRDEYPQGTVSSDINTSPEIPSETRENFNNITTTVEEEQPLNEPVETQFKHKNYTDEIETLPANSEASRLHYDEKGDRNKVEETHDEKEETENASNLSGSNVEYGKNTVPSVTDNLAPVYGKDAEEESVVESKEYGTSTGSGGVETETKDGVKDGHDKGVSMKDYFAEKLKPGEEDKALSELISETLHKPKEEPVKKEQKDLVSEDEKPEKASEESYLSMMKGAVGSWFAKSEETQSPHVAEGEDLSKTKNSDAEVERVGQAVDEPRKQE